MSDLTFGWWVVKSPRWGWAFTVYEHGKGGRRVSGWRPTKRLAARARNRADRRMGRGR